MRMMREKQHCKITKVRKERGGSALGAGEEIPLQPLEKTMVEQVGIC